MERTLAYFFFIISILSLTQVAVVVQSGATLELLLRNYQNPEEKLRDGSCCDLFCAGQCDHIFHFALDQSTGSTTDALSYSIWSQTTGTFQDQNIDYFNSDMHGVADPIVHHFTSWPGAILFKVYIEDDDSPYSSNDDVDSIIYRLTLTPTRSSATATAATVTMQGNRPSYPTTMTMDVKLYCDNDYYGTDCSVYCAPQDSSQYGHYTCDPVTGSKICRQGWEDPSGNCLTVSDDCIGNTCQNGARCIDGIRSYTCRCIPGFTGQRCETNINECLSSPCRNGGTCSDLINGYTCACTTGYVGPQCAQAACNQPDAEKQCQNGGTCYGDLKCLCPPGYVGKGCELRTCEAIPCLNGGTCTNNSTCMCMAGYAGTQCEIKLCSLIAGRCLNGGSCSNGICVCPAPYWGVSCEKENCSNSTCLNGASCMDTDAGYQCLCNGSYTGHRCEVAPLQLCSAPLLSDPQALQGSHDVSIFQNDNGRALIALIVVCAVFLIIIIILICFIICNRRRQKRAAERKPELSTIEASSVATTTVRTRIENNYSNGDEVAEAKKKSVDDLKEMKVINYCELSLAGYVDSNADHYETLDNKAICSTSGDETNNQNDYSDGVDPRLTEQRTCKIVNDVHGEPMCNSKKQADC